MVGSQTGVSIRLRKEVNSFLFVCCCVAHRTNLTTLDVANTPDCKVLSTEIDVLINFISSFFYKFCKRKHALTTFHEQLFKKTMKRYYKIHGLNRWQAISSLCDSLEYVFDFF